MYCFVFDEEVAEFLKVLFDPFKSFPTFLP